MLFLYCFHTIFSYFHATFDAIFIILIVFKTLLKYNIEAVDFNSVLNSFFNSLKISPKIYYKYIFVPIWKLLFLQNTCKIIFKPVFKTICILFLFRSLCSLELFSR